MSIKSTVTAATNKLIGDGHGNTILVNAFSYKKATAPKGYQCHECKVSGVKLWREYMTFLDQQSLLCAVCALERADASRKENESGCKYEGPADENGKVTVVYMDHGMTERTDNIGWLVPAVPTEDGETYWGYSSVPAEGVSWWRSLPTHKR